MVNMNYGDPEEYRIRGGHILTPRENLAPGRVHEASQRLGQMLIDDQVLMDFLESLGYGIAPDDAGYARFYTLDGRLVNDVSEALKVREALWTHPRFIAFADEVGLEVVQQ